MNENIMYDINTMYFSVDLIHGTVIYSHNRNIAGSNKICRNIQEANLYSLNILKQNVIEEEFKTGEAPKSIIRYFLGNQQVIDPATIIPTMKWLQETFPEKLI